MVFGMSKVIAERVRVSVCVCISPVDLLQPLPRQPDVPLWRELRAHIDQSLGRPETTHTPHTGTARSQLLD